jgi:hypothetical protein
VEPEFRFEEGTEGLAGSATVRSQTRGIVGGAMRRRKWREGKVRPIPGNPPHDRPGKPEDFFLVKGEFATIPSSPLLSATANNTGRPVCVFKACRNLSGPMWFRNQNQTLGWDRAASRWSAPSPGSRTCREDHAPSHRPQMSSDRLFLDRVARQHCPSPLHRHAQITTPPRPAGRKQDISTLQRIGHFYFALTLLHGIAQYQSLIS